MNKLFFIAVVATAWLSLYFGQVEGTYTSLTYYVNSIDKVYHWNVSDTVIRADNYTVYNIYLTSQQWLTKDESNHPIWNHWVQLCVPDDRYPDSDLAYLYIDGGSNKNFDNPPKSLDSIVERFCLKTRTLAAGLYQIPNEPITFTGDPGHPRTEDALIAYTWSHFINNTNEPDWLARMPMTKASIKAMDAIQEFLATKAGEIRNVSRFVVGGGSKRGWTAWMVGAMGDPRVVAINPLVAPIANLIPQINEMWQSYGTWSFALQDYVDMDLMGHLNLPVFEQLLHIIDPLTYLPEMQAIPKYVVGALGDEFFMPDSAKYFWPQLPGEKWLRMVPNAEHSLAGSVENVLDSVVQWYGTFLSETITRPSYNWTISADGQTITVTSTTDGLLADEARVWYSRNNKKRDWRLITCTESSPKCINLALFSSAPLQMQAPGVFTYTLEAPDPGKYSAFIIELKYDLGDSSDPFKVTSDLSIIPLEMPYPPCPIDVCACGYFCPNNTYYGGF